MRVAFLLQDLQLSGGVGVIVEHAAQLRRHHGIDATLVLTRPQEHPDWGYRGLADVPVVPFAEAVEQDWDVAVSSWWQTTSVLFELRARRHVSFVQLLEDSTYADGTPERMAAALSTALPVRFVTEARWIAELLEDLQPGNRVHYVRNGVPKDVFSPPDAVAPALDGAPLRVVLEGAREYVAKGVDDALAAVALMREPAHVTWVSPHPAAAPEGVDEVLHGLTHAAMADLFARSHVLVKLSRAEGMYGPPLEAFHMGATVVTTPVTGHEEYVLHGENGLVVGWDDRHGTARALDLLARDRRLLHELRSGALRTARAWPDWPQASAWMALVLRRILDEPEPRPAAAGRRLVSDFSSVIAEAQEERWRLDQERAARMELVGQRGLRPMVARRLRREAGRVKAKLKRMLRLRR